MWRKGDPLALLVGMYIDTTTMEKSMEISLKTSNPKRKTPAIPLLGIYPEKTIIEKGTCTPVFIAVLCTRARTWKQPRRPSTDEWIKKLWYIYTMDYYSTTKRGEFESGLVRWMKLESITQNKVSQKKKNKYHILTHIYGI